MKVVSIGSDRKLFEEGSEVRTRAVAYAARFGELQVVVFSLRGHRLMEKHEGALHIYPTNSRSRLFYIFDAARIARRLQGDIVTTQDPFESGLAGLLARKGRPLHVQLHTDPFAPEFGRGLNVVRRFITRVVLPRAARIRVVLERVAAELRKRYPHIPVSVLPIFVDVEKYKNLERQTHPRFKTALLWVGRFEQEKNPALAIRALADARAAGHEAGLVMLGNGSLEKQLRAEISRRNLDAYVELPGWQESLSYMKVTDLLLATSYYEGYGRQIIEALAAGVPVLSTDVGVAREAGAIVTTEKDFVDALNKWFTNGPRTAELTNYPYQSFEEYVEKYCADIEAAVTLI